MDVMGQVIDMDEDEQHELSTTAIPMLPLRDGGVVDIESGSDSDEVDFGLDGRLRSLDCGARGFSKRIVADFFEQADVTIDSMRQAL